MGRKEARRPCTPRLWTAIANGLLRSKLEALIFEKGEGRRVLPLDGREVFPHPPGVAALPLYMIEPGGLVGSCKEDFPTPVHDGRTCNDTGGGQGVF